MKELWDGRRCGMRAGDEKSACGILPLSGIFCATKLELYGDVNCRPFSFEYKAELS
jgi:hypothetical protein